MTTTPPALLGRNSYGKSLVRVLKVVRNGAVHDICELSVNIALHGEFTNAHTHGDNTDVLPTDTMKNTVYVRAKDHALDSIESFALDLTAHFVATHAPAAGAQVSIAMTSWNRAQVAGRPHEHTFIRGTQERALCEVTLDRGSEPLVRSGFAGLVILKSTDSAFSGFTRDRYTTLKDADDRIFCTSVSAWWAFPRFRATDFAQARSTVRDALVETFALHKSKSVQHTLFAMGQSALARCPSIDSVSLSMPNKHCLLVDLSPFGLENRNEVFVPTDEPHGLIEAVVTRP